MKDKKGVRIFVIAVLLLLLLEAVINFRFSMKKNEPIKIVFLVDGDDSMDYENMKAGASSAGEDGECLIDFVDISKEKNVVADQVYIAANHNLELSNSRKLVDDFNMAKDLSSYILSNSDCSNILIVSSGDSGSYENTLEGFESTLTNAGKNVEYRPLSKNAKMLKQSMYNLEQSGFFDLVIALDRYSLAAAVEANNRKRPFVKIYGVDNSSEAVYYLDNGAVEALAYKDEYSMGYTAVRHALKDDKLKKIVKEKTFYYIANRKSLYSDDMEMVLFPFVK